MVKKSATHEIVFLIGIVHSDGSFFGKKDMITRFSIFDFLTSLILFKKYDNTSLPLYKKEHMNYR